MDAAETVHPTETTKDGKAGTEGRGAATVR